MWTLIHIYAYVYMNAKTHMCACTRLTPVLNDVRCVYFFCFHLDNFPREKLFLCQKRNKFWWLKVHCKIFVSHKQLFMLFLKKLNKKRYTPQKQINGRPKQLYAELNACTHMWNKELMPALVIISLNKWWSKN